MLYTRLVEQTDNRRVIVCFYRVKDPSGKTTQKRLRRAPVNMRVNAIHRLTRLQDCKHVTYACK